MSVNTQDNTRLRAIEEMKDKQIYCGNQCSSILEILSQRGVDIGPLKEMGLSSDEMTMVALYFTFKNEEINLSHDISLLENEEMDGQTRNRELNQLEADRKIEQRKKEEEQAREQKQAEEKQAAENSYYNNQPDSEPER